MPEVGVSQALRGAQGEAGPALDRVRGGGACQGWVGVCGVWALVRPHISLKANYLFRNDPGTIQNAEQER